MKVRLGNILLKDNDKEFGLRLYLEDASPIRAWIKRKLLWALEYMGAIGTMVPVPQEFVSYEMISVDADKLFDMIRRHADQIHFKYNRDIERIIVGRDGMLALNIAVLNEPMYMRIPMDISKSIVGGLSTFEGVPIQFIPWAEGILLVPKHD